jgi:cytochrome c oxidase cbb3-type subunit 3
MNLNNIFIKLQTGIIMHSKNKISMILAAALLLFPTFVFAANGQAKGDSVNMALISLLGLMLILLFVIGMLANTLRNLSYVVRDKIRKDKNTAGNVVKALLVLLALSIPAIQSYAADAPKAATGPVTQYISGIPEGDFYTILGVIALELISIFALVYHINVLMKVIHSQPELAKAAGPVIEKSWFWDSFNAAASLEKEKDILMDHNYDGIQELDNSLPPWWKYGFYLTIIVAVIYLYRFHVSHDGLSPKEEYAAEMQKAAEDKEAYLATAGNLVDENTVTLLTDPNEIAAGKEIFVKTCAPCHLADGGGAVGPNLTDEYWLHGGSIKDIFKSIKYGWQDKGMKSWKDDFSPKQIQQLASFVKSLKGSHPAVPKLAQGELYIEAGAAPAANDSTKKAGDSTAVKK